MTRKRVAHAAGGAPSLRGRRAALELVSPPPSMEVLSSSAAFGRTPGATAPHSSLINFIFAVLTSLV